MQSERWQTCMDVFNAAVERPPDERAAFLEGSCDGDEALRRKVELLLKYHDTSGDFIKSPAFKVAPELLADDPETLIGQHLGCYRVDAVAGVGGMGVVYVAWDERLGRKVALKLLPQSMVAKEADLKRLKREARTASALNHPNIVTIHDIGEVGSTHYVATEFIEGITLRERITKGPIPPNEAVDIAVQVASALCVAHRVSIVHRDIKPENIMLRPDGYVKVLDFGIAKFVQQETLGTTKEVCARPVTQQSMVLGTTRYMSPEQAMAQAADTRSDLWSLGVVLYEMVTEHAPSTGDTPRDIMASILEKEPPALTSYIKHIPSELQHIVTKALRKDRTERYQSAGEMLQALKHLRHKLELKAAPLWLRWIRSSTALLAVLLASAVALMLPFYPHRSPATSLPAEKSIAVLPFENLSNNKENAFFADGVQDDLLTKLAKIADLKVISRTSAMEYRGARNIRQIGDALRVSHVLEGSVRRDAGRIHFNVQLIDTRTDTHLWAEEYDRDVNDMFAIESEVAQKVAEQLHTKISVAEKESIERQPTSDLTAFDLYTRAKNLFLGATISNNGKRDLLDAADLLNQAVSRDPAYFQAYCQLVWTHDLLYSLGHDHSPERLALAETAIEAAFHLRPDAGEAHLARAENLYDGYLDYDDSLAELKVARQSLPNDPRVFELKGYIERRQGKLEEALHSLERSVELDPRNILMIQQIGATYHYLRRYAEENSMYNRAQAIEPNDLGTKVGRARVDLDWKADPRPMHELIDSVRATEPGAIKRIADSWTVCALAERDAAGARQAVIAAGENTPLNQNAVHFSGSFVDGLVARMTGDNARARSAFLAARAEQEQSVRLQPNYAPPLCVLGVIDAALGRKEEALREGRHAVELLPVEKDLGNGALMLEYLAIIAAWLGDKDLACEELSTVIRYPGFLSYGELKLLPFWDPLRGDPRFEKIVAALAPK